MRPQTKKPSPSSTLLLDPAQRRVPTFGGISNGRLFFIFLLLGYLSFTALGYVGSVQLVWNQSYLLQMKSEDVLG